MKTVDERIFAVDLDEFEERVLEASADAPVLVDFWAEWCPPCVVIAPVLEDVVHQYRTPVSLAKVEVDEGDNMKLAGRFQVRGFPTVILFDTGRELGRFSGAKTAGQVRGFLDQHL